MGVLRDLFRRKGRSILTITGIAVGVFALVVLGAASEWNNIYSVKLAEFYESAVTVAEKDDMSYFGLPNGSRPLSMKKVDEVAAYPGVAAAFPQISMLLDDEFLSIMPPMIMSIAPGISDYEASEIAKGRAILGEERGVTVLGSDLARRLQADVGQTVELRGKRFVVAGIAERTYIGLIDASTWVGIDDARELYIDDLPSAFQKKVEAEDLAVGMTVYAEDGVDPNELARNLERDIEGIATTAPTEMMETVDGMIGLFNAVVASVAFIALLVGGLSIVNTMTMAISERTREIGVKRALGATKGRIVRDVVAESSIMAGIGGAIGLVFGTLAAHGLNSALLAATGTSAFLITWRLIFGALAFSIILGALGGLYPANRASRLDPATALAHR